LVRKKKKSEEIPELCFEEDMEENGFVDAALPVGEVFRTFNFQPAAIEAASKDNYKEISKNENINASEATEILDNRKVKTVLNDKTPEIDNEAFEIQRYYKIRKSTARMLNEIKAIHPNVNVYMNTIVDAALRHYYNYIFNENGELH
jgi:hypothetical protein